MNFEKLLASGYVRNDAEYAKECELDKFFVPLKSTIIRVKFGAFYEEDISGIEVYETGEVLVLAESGQEVNGHRDDVSFDIYTRLRS